MLALTPNKAGHNATIKITTPKIVSPHLQLQLNIFQPPSENKSKKP